jgi:Lrp/AsnC family transcriptional regulator, leucine-responsive regulatory protein
MILRTRGRPRRHHVDRRSHERLAVVQPKAGAREGRRERVENVGGLPRRAQLDPPVVDPPDEVHADTAERAVARGQHRVREHGRGDRSDGEPADALPSEPLEHGDTPVGVRAIGAAASKAVLDPGERDRCVAIGHIGTRDERGRRDPAQLPTEEASFAAPVAQHDRGRHARCDGDPVREHLPPERALDAWRDTGHGRRIVLAQRRIETAEKTDATGFGATLELDARTIRRRRMPHVPSPLPRPRERGQARRVECAARERTSQSVGRGSVARRARSPTQIREAAADRRSGRPSPYDAGVLDDRDLTIIAALQEDARATYADVGRRVGLSPSSVHDRVRKLEQGGVIRGYRAIVDPESIGLFVTALVAVTPLDPMQPDDLPDRVREFPEVEDCFSVAGEANYILKVRTRTTSHLEDLIRRLREKGGVQTRTTVVLSTPFEGRARIP